MTRTALVTGASGNLGSRLVQRLRNTGTRVVAITRDERHGIDSDSGNVMWRSADLRDDAVAADVVREHAPDLVVHAAWETTHGEFWNSSDNHAWAKASCAMIDSAAERPTCRFVFVSTCAEYTWGASAPLREDAPEEPWSLYGRSKLVVTRHLQTRTACGDLDGISLRLFFPYGPGEAATRLFPYIASRLAAGLPAQLGSPNHVRDFCHIDDVADGILAAADSSLSGVVNLASGQGVRVGDAARMFATCIDDGARLEYGASVASENDPQFLVADTTRLSSVWEPSIDIAGGLRRYAQTLRCRGGGIAT